MIKSFNLKMFAVVLVTAVGCTKLDERLNSTLTNGQTATALGSSGVGLLLQAAYNDLGGTFNTQDGVFSWVIHFKDTNGIKHVEEGHLSLLK